MKYFWYTLFPIDLFLGNVHFIYTLYPASTEWYSSDVSEFLRVTIWCLVGSIFGMKATGIIKEDLLTKGIAVSMLWWGINTILDVTQTIQEINYTDPSIEIAVAVIGVIAITLYFLKSDVDGARKVN